MATLQDLKTAYQKQLDQWQQENEAKERAIEAERQAILDDLRPRIISWIAKREDVDEAELNQFGTLTPDWRDNWNKQEGDKKRLNNVTFTLTLPEHQGVSFSFYQDHEGKVIPNNKAWYIDEGGRQDYLGPALIRAAEVWQREKEQEAKRNADNESWQKHQAEKKEQEQREQDEMQSILNQVATDPAAVLILKLFAMIQAERTGLTEKIDDLYQSVESQAYYHESGL
jgi:hypothetical protein